MRAALLSFATASLLLFATGASATTLKIATLAPGGSAWMLEMKAAADEIAERTEGRVKLKFYPGGVMGDDQTVLRKMRVGQLHGGAFSSGALGNVLPDVNLYSLPLLFRSYEEVYYVRERLDAELATNLEAKGYVVVAFSNNGFAYFMSTHPVRTVSDLDGAKVWIPQGDVMSETTLNVAGVSPIQLPLPDVYTGLQSGLIDTVAVPPIGAIAFQWHTTLKYLTDTPLMYLLTMMVVEAKAWHGISAEDQKTVRSQVQNAARKLDDANRIGEQNALVALGQQGIETVSPTPEELLRWHKLSQDAIVKLRADKIYSNQRIDRIEQYLKEYRSLNVAADGS
jgi:TRAP-type C4-dicarboxylate transport system substrate-binding protein